MTLTEKFFLVSFLVLIGLHMGRDEEPAQKVVIEKWELSDKRKAELYAEIVVGCLNGQWIFIDDKPAAECRRIK
jgi:hypothetical protein